jgi:carbonic anhydrase
MEAPLDRAKHAGLAKGGMDVIGNAGGRASDDAIRSLVISTKLVGTPEWFLIHHTDCGMQLFTDDLIGRLLEQSLHKAGGDDIGWQDHGRGPGSVDGRFVEWHSVTDLVASVVEDVKRIRSHPLVRGNIPIHGHSYDVTTGRLSEIEAATETGEPTQSSPLAQCE